MKPWMLTACVVGLVCVSGRADDSAAPPTGAVDPQLSGVMAIADGNSASDAMAEDKSEAKSGSTTRPDRMDALASRPNRNWPGSRPGRSDNFSPDEWDSTAAWMKEQSPVRLRVINNLPDGPRKSNMMNLAVREYRNFQKFTSDPDLGPLTLEQTKLEDSIFDLGRQLRRADAAQQESIKETLHERVGDLVDTNLKVRQVRIGRLKKTLDTETSNLEKDTARRDELADEQYEQILKRFNAYVEPSTRPAAGSPQP